MKTQKTILVTGGAGALGSYIVKRYLEEGHRVLCLDNLMKTKTTENVDAFLKNKNFRFIKHDITDPIDFPGEKIDWIFNAACPVSCISLQVDPIHTAKSSTIGVINMLELAKKHGATFLQCSSADIYGEMTDHPFSESDWGSVNTISPRACYEEGKRMAETICMDYHRLHGVPVKIARIFNTAGPHTQMTDGRIPASFIYWAMSNRPIRIYGKGRGTGTRAFLHVEDQVEALDRFMKTPAEVTGPINIGSDKETTIIDLAKKIIEKTDSKSEIVFEREDDAPQFRKPDISLAKELLAWEPTRSLDELLDDMIAHYRHKGLPEGRVLVFAVTFYPDHGPAEETLLSLAEAMPETEFHVITSRFAPGRRAYERLNNITIHRIGFGFPFDKYLLPFLGALKAQRLNKTYRFRFFWSIMASYGALAGLILKLLGSRASFILERDQSERMRGGLRGFLMRAAERRADTTLSPDAAREADAFIGTVRAAYAALTKKQEGTLDRPV